MKAIEELLRNAGISPIAGVDEAGRGPCAGPLVIAAVILKDVANLDGMRRAVKGLQIEPAYVLTDGYAIEGLAIPNVAVWKGDQVVTAISAASIIAKVTRDRMMVELDAIYPQYGFAQHKGYITAAHTAALQAHGPCAEHRKSFSNIASLLR